MEKFDIEQILNHFEISKTDKEDLRIFSSEQIENIGAAVIFDLSKGKGRAIIDYDPAYPFAVLRVCTV